MRSLHFAALPCLASLFLTACAPGSGAPQDGPVASSESAIRNGTTDSTHKAVVAVLSDNTECSGTIVKVSGTTAYVLTAGHCCASDVLPSIATTADDYSAMTASNTFNIVQSSIKQDPNYNSNAHTHDFCMFQFTSQSPSSLQVIPVVTGSDGLQAGSTVTFVGYGVTGYNGTTPIENSKRRQKSGPLTAPDANFLYYNEASTGADAVNGGPCEGDSGGPALVTIGGSLVVVGVTSAGDPTCSQYGESGRVQSVNGTSGFITAYLNGDPIVPAMDCDTCYTDATSGGGACSSVVDTCLNDATCKALVTCLNGCGQTDTTCEQTCANNNQAGLAKYNAISTCVCTTGCATQCGSESFCQGSSAKCGLSAQDATCQTCFESKCCSQAEACANDTSCTACLVASPAASCSSEASYEALLTCLSSNCNSECGGGSSSTSSTTGAGNGATTGATTGSGAGNGATTGSGTVIAGSTGTGTVITTGTGAGTGGAGGDGSGDSGQSSGCSVAPSGSSTSPLGALVGLAAASLMVARRRRQA